MQSMDALQQTGGDSSLSFNAIAESYKANCEPAVSRAKGQNISICESLYSMVGDISDRQKYEPEDFITGILGSEGLRLRIKGRNLPSKVGEFNTAYKKNLLMGYLEMRYDRKFFRTPPITAQFNQVNTLTGLTPGEAWRLYTDLQPKVAVLEPDIPLTSICEMVSPASTLAARIPEIVITKREATMEDVAESGQPQRAALRFSSKNVVMQKAGVLLELSEEAQEADNMGVDLVARVFERAGVNDEIDIVNALVKIARDNAGTAESLSALSGRKLLDIQASFGRGRRGDRVIGNKDSVLDYVDQLSKAYVDQDSTTRGAALLAQPNLINVMSRPTLCGYLHDYTDADSNAGAHMDATEAGLQDNQLMVIDSMNTLGIVTYQNDPYQAENFDVIKQVHQHVMTRWWAGYTQVDGPIKLYSYT